MPLYPKILELHGYKPISAFTWIDQISEGDSPQRIESVNTGISTRCSDNKFNTPVNRRKRAYFAEESPSQDFESHASSVISQEASSSGVDVDWKWEDYSIHKEDRRCNSDKIIKLKLRNRNKNCLSTLSSDVVQKKGFHKFKEELLLNLHHHTSVDDKGRDQMETPVIVDNQFEETNLEGLLFESSQLTESGLNNNAQYDIESTGFSSNIDFNRTNVEQDSMDELLLSLPIDDNIYNNDDRYENVISKNETAQRCSDIPQINKSLIRHSSMPLSPQTNCIRKRSSNYLFVRHNSMPADEEPKKAAPKVFSSVSTETITSSQSSDFEKRRCTTEEIKEKRLQAIQRREASKRKTFFSHK